MLRRAVLASHQERSASWVLSHMPHPLRSNEQRTAQPVMSAMDRTQVLAVTEIWPRLPHLLIGSIEELRHVVR